MAQHDRRGEGTISMINELHISTKHVYTHRRAECAQENPGMSAAEVMQLMEGEWRNMTDEEKAQSA